MSRGAAIAACAVAVGACGGPASTFDPGGPAARQIGHLAWLLIAVAGAIYLLVLAALALASQRRFAAASRRLDMGVLAGGAVLPLAILVGLFVASTRTLTALTRPEPASLVIDVTGRQYWWALRYRDASGAELAATANELHLPQGRRVELRLRSMDVIHSFWVPALQGKLDLVPGKTNVTWVQGDRAGVYHGQCAEYCGIQHALMQLVVVVQRAEDFDAWLAAQREPASPPTDARGQRAQQLFFVHCAHCHTIRGTPAFFGDIGPDLTHLRSRRTLASGTMPNGDEHIARWLADPQALKPGNLMPRVPLAPDEFRLVLDYLLSLR